MLVRAVMFCYVMLCAVLHHAVLSCVVLFCYVLFCCAIFCGVMPARASIRTPHVHCWLNRREISCIAFWEDCFVLCYSVLCCAVLYCAVLWCIVTWALQPISPRSIYNLPLRCWLMLFYTVIYCPIMSFCVL